MCVMVVRLCVCVCERERERERDATNVQYGHAPVQSQFQNFKSWLPESRTEREREREYKYLVVSKSSLDGQLFGYI